MPLSSNIILTPDRLHTEVQAFLDHEAFAFDVESWGDNRGVPSQNTVNWLSMATHGRAIAIPFGHPNGDRLLSKATRRKDKATGKFFQVPATYDAPPEQMRPSEVFEILRPLFFSDRVKVAHNATFDLISVQKYFGEQVPAPYADTIVMAHLLDENAKQKGLKDLVKRLYRMDYDTENVGKQVEAHPFSKVARYAYLDAKYTWLLYQRFLPQISAQELDQVWQLEMDVLETLVSMGVTGAPVDVSAIQGLEADLSERLVEIEGRIYKAAGQEFNINSVPQKQAVLFGSKEEGGQGLKPYKFTDSGAPSTDAESLEHYPKNEVATALLEYAEISKLLSTYVRGYLGEPGNAKKPNIIFDGRIHADFVQYGTVTGRFSCRAPNLQNIPRPDTDLGKQIRGLFVAPPGHKLIVADYGQIEMVLLAHFAGRGPLYQGFFDGVDPHTMTAARVFGVSPEEVTKDQRQAAKGINFAVVYGAGPDKVASMAGTTTKEAKRFLEIHQKQFPEIYRFKDDVIKTCRSRRPPYVKTLFGRRRRLPTIFSDDFGLRGYAERQAVNSLIQGSAADLIKLAMVRLHRSLDSDMHLILSVHDELVTIVPDAKAERGADIVREAMLGEDIQSLVRVPLSSDLKVVDRWAEAK